MPAPAPPSKRGPPFKREPRRPSPKGEPKEKLIRGGPPTRSRLLKPMEPVEEKDRLEEEQVVSASEVLTAETVEPQSHEVELMAIPVKNYVEGENAEMAHEEKEKEDLAAQPRRRMSSESSETRRRPVRGDSEVKIEEILTRVFEDITTQPKPAPKKAPQTRKSPAPISRKPPIPNAVKAPPKPAVPKQKSTATSQPAKKPAVEKQAPKKPEEKPAPPHDNPPQEPVKPKPTPTITPLEKKKPAVPTAHRAAPAAKQPAAPKKVASTTVKAAVPKKTPPAKKLP